MSVPAAFNRDENFVPITNLGFVTSKTITFDAGTTGAIGETTLFEVTGVVSIAVMGVVGGTDLTGSGVVEVGDDTTANQFLEQEPATNLDTNFIWNDATPSLVGALPTTYVMSGGNVVQTISTDTVTGGTVTYYCFWVPISSNATVSAV